MIAIIVSLKDPAGVNIKERLVENYQFKECGIFEQSSILEFSEDLRLYTTQKDSVACENIDDVIEADKFIFATKHESVSRIPSLCVHAPGNWGIASLGGSDYMLCLAPALLMRSALFRLKEAAKGSDYEVIQECTHHGPMLRKPAMFIEIGSCKDRWKDPWAAKIIAKTIMEIAREPPEDKQIAVGIGGPHHTIQFTRLMEKRTDIAFGHICPKYNLDNLDKAMLMQAIEKSHPRCDLVVVQWKGVSGHKDKLKTILEGIDFMKI